MRWASRSRSSTARRSPNGVSIRSLSSIASRSKATNAAGVCSASMRTRDCGRVDALLQGIEVEAVARRLGHDDLTVDHAPLGKGRRAAAAISSGK